MKYVLLFVSGLFVFLNCATKKDMEMSKTFLDDYNFLSQYAETIVLKSPEGDGQILVVPDYQGRIMTSTLSGETGSGFGWINYDKIAEQQIDTIFNAFGGEDRFWLGPEGGQFSLFHKPGKAFSLDNWFVPRQIDTQPYQVTKHTNQSLKLSADFVIKNYSHSSFKLKVNRDIRVFSRKEIEKILKFSPDSELKMVGFESDNRITNTGQEAWNKTEGLISIWILGMYNPGDEVIIMLPYYEGGTGSLGTVVNSDYFGEVPPERLRAMGGLVFFKGDGKYRSKIGMNWMRAMDILGSYDPDRQVLTIIKYNKPEKEAEYVKAKWQIMDNPYGGDVVNSYNDGKAAPDKEAMGPFYELETSSPVRELQTGEFIQHTHQTFHIQGSEEALSRITEKIFNAKLQKIKDAFLH